MKDQQAQDGNVNPSSSDARAASSEVAEDTKEMLGDLKVGTEAVLEGNARMTRQLGELTQYGLDALAASSKLSVEGVGVFSRESAEFSRKNLEHVSGAMRRFTQVRTPSEFLQIQSEFAKASIENAVACSTKLGEAVLRLAGEMAQSVAQRPPRHA